MRFNSPEHLETWRTTGRYPAIHDALANVAVADVRGRRLVDLGCSYGLLGARVVAEAGLEFGLGIDADGAVLAAARAAGVPIELEEMKVTEVTIPRLSDMLEYHRIDVMVARRVLPELFGADLTAGQRFVEMLCQVGIKEVFLEGRVDSPKSVNALRSIAQEVELLAPWFREVRRIGGVSYLVAA